MAKWVVGFGNQPPTFDIYKQNKTDLCFVHENVCTCSHQILNNICEHILFTQHKTDSTHATSIALNLSSKIKPHEHMRSSVFIGNKSRYGQLQTVHSKPVRAVRRKKSCDVQVSNLEIVEGGPICSTDRSQFNEQEEEKTSWTLLR